MTYLDTIVCEIEVPFLANQRTEIAALVLPTTDYSLQVPVIVGTNAISRCRERCENATKGIPTQWRNAFTAMQQSRLGVVKSTLKNSAIT